MESNIPGWEVVLRYLQKNTIEAMSLAILEADKILVLIARNAAKKDESDEESLLRISGEYASKVDGLRRCAISLRAEPGFVLPDYYSGNDLVEQYHAIISHILSSVVRIGEGDHPLVLRSKRWLFMRRMLVLAWAKRIGAVALLLVFFSDTVLGKMVLEFLVGQIHAVLVVLLILLVGAFVLFTLFILMATAVDSIRGKGKKKRR